PGYPMTTAAKERPILFSSEMVRAILAGRKRMTRRVVGSKQFGPSDTTGYDWHFRGTRRGGKTSDLWQDMRHEQILNICPLGKVGDRLWIKTGYSTQYNPQFDEAFWIVPERFITTRGRALSKSGKAKRDGNHPGMFMPYWLSQELRIPT